MLDPESKSAQPNIAHPKVTVYSQDSRIFVPAASTFAMGIMIAIIAGLMVLFMRRKMRRA
jgi:hypothetical protein